MAKGSPHNEGRGPKWVARLRGLREIALSIGAIALLFSTAFGIIIHSPVPERAATSNSSGVMLAAALITFAVGVGIVVLLFTMGNKENLKVLISERGRTLYNASRAIASVTLLFCASLWLIGHTSLTPPALSSDWAGALLAAASLALFVFSILIALVALVGLPNLGKYIVGQIETAVNPALSKVRKELSGRTICASGYILGELSLAKEEGSFRVERRELLDSAVESCLSGFRVLEGVGGGPRLMALNNWLYYSSLQEKTLPLLTDSEALRYARELEKVGRENRVTRLQLTYCRVVAKRIADRGERLRAKNLLHAIEKNLSPYEWIEAQDCLKLLATYDPKHAYGE